MSVPKCLTCIRSALTVSIDTPGSVNSWCLVSACRQASDAHTVFCQAASCLKSVQGVVLVLALAIIAKPLVQKTFPPMAKVEAHTGQIVVGMATVGRRDRLQQNVWEGSVDDISVSIVF